MKEIRIPLDYRRYAVEFLIRPIEGEPDSHHIELYANGCLRKDRTGPDTLYLWTNLELEWEEHHLVEARLRPAENGSRTLVVTMNREVILEQQITLAA